MPHSSLKIRLGTTIARLRACEGLSKTKLGLMVGVSRQYVERIEKGEANPTIDMLVRIADGLGLTLEDLIDESHDIDADIVSVSGR